MELAELLDMANAPVADALAPQAAPPRWRQRSGELLKHARAEKQRKQVERDAEAHSPKISLVDACFHAFDMRSACKCDVSTRKVAFLLYVFSFDILLQF